MFRELDKCRRLMYWFWFLVSTVSTVKEHGSPRLSRGCLIACNVIPNTVSTGSLESSTLVLIDKFTNPC